MIENKIIKKVFHKNNTRNMSEIANFDKEYLLNYYKEELENKWDWNQNRYIVKVNEVLEIGDINTKTSNGVFYLYFECLLDCDIINFISGKTILFNCSYIQENTNVSIKSHDFMHFNFEDILTILISSREIKQFYGTIDESTLKNMKFNIKLITYVINRQEVYIGIGSPYLYPDIFEVLKYKFDFYDNIYNFNKMEKNINKIYIENPTKFIKNPNILNELFVNDKILTNDLIYPISNQNYKKLFNKELNSLFVQFYPLENSNDFSKKQLEKSYDIFRFENYKNITSFKNIEDYEEQFYSKITNIFSKITKSKKDNFIIDFPVYFKFETLKYLYILYNSFNYICLYFNHSKGPDFVLSLFLYGKKMEKIVFDKNILIDENFYKICKSNLSFIAWEIYNFVQMEKNIGESNKKLLEKNKKDINKLYEDYFL